MPTLYLSTVGTSVLTNHPSVDRKVAFRHANAPALSDAGDDASTLVAWLDEARSVLVAADLAGVRKASAELNSLLALGDGSVPMMPDQHLLLPSDTWMGRETAAIVADWLRANGASVTVFDTKGLRGDRLASFQASLPLLVKELIETLRTYRRSGYRIVFNLTGGFKSFNGFLASLAPHYADETVYLFESSAEPLRIPHLPVRLALGDAVEEHLPTLRRMARGLPVSDAEARALPPLLTFEAAPGLWMLSEWGEVVWDQEHRALYEQKLRAAPSGQIVYGDRFAASVNPVSPQRTYAVNERLDDLAVFLETGQTVKRLDLKKLRGSPKPGLTHELDAWADGGAKRIYGTLRDGVFTADHLGDHL